MHPANLDPLPETLLITVWARAAESRRGAAAVLRDPAAERLADQLDYDFGRFEGAWKTQIGVAVRGRAIDDHARDFLARHPGATVVNLGAGLDTRADRLAAGRWVDVDLPEVIRLRKAMLPLRGSAVAASLLETGWIDALPDGPLLFIAEGVLMFLPRADVAALLARLAAARPGSEIVFDVIGGVLVTFPFLHDTLSRVADGRVRFAWGVRGPAALEGRFAALEVLRWQSMLDESPRRWRWMRLLRSMPVMHRQFALVRASLGRGSGTC